MLLSYLGASAIFLFRFSLDDYTNVLNSPQSAQKFWLFFAVFLLLLLVFMRVRKRGRR